MKRIKLHRQSLSVVCTVVVTSGLVWFCSCTADPAGGNSNVNENRNTSEPPGSGSPFNDPLSIPVEPTLEIQNFESSLECAACHPQHYREWSSSSHAYAMVDPVYRALVAVRRSDFNGERDGFCTQCHSAIGTRAGECAPFFEWEELSPITLEGVTCVACHKIESVERVYNSGHVIDQTGPMRGPLADYTSNSFHECDYSPVHDKSEFCAGCHDVIEQHGLTLERPYEEWLASPAVAEGTDCQDCHMKTYQGQAAVVSGAPVRDGVHSHKFVGVDMPLTDDFISDPAVLQEHREDIATLLQSAGRLDLSVSPTVLPGEQLDVFVTVENLINAHNLPTGSTFNRQCWVWLEARDATGRILYQTGHLDDNGDLRNHWSALDPYGDHDLINFSSGFIDAAGNPTVFPWKAVEHLSTSMSPQYKRTYTLFVPTDAEVVGPITIEAKLQFRQFPPFLLRALGLNELVSKLEIFQIDEASATVEVNGSSTA